MRIEKWEEFINDVFDFGLPTRDSIKDEKVFHNFPFVQVCKIEFGSLMWLGTLKVSLRLKMDFQL